MTVRSVLSKFLNLKPSMYSRSLAFNMLGAQLARIGFFHLRRIARFPKKIRSEYRPYLSTLERDGILVIPNFFPDAQYAALKQTYDALVPQLRIDNSEIPVPRVDSISIHNGAVSAPFREAFTKNPLIRELSAAFLGRAWHPPLDARITRISCSQEDLDKPKNGGTNNLHFDAPLRVLKAFYYVSDADENNAALRYCVGSQKRDTLKRLLFEYKLSVRYARNRGNDAGGEYMPGEPWVKITPEEMQEHGLAEKSLAVKGNSIVFVNTGGFHRRGDFLKPGVRETIEINYRGIESLRNALYAFKRV